MKNVKKGDSSKSLTIIMFSIIAFIFIIVGFLGIYVVRNNQTFNLIPKFKYGTELGGVMEYRFSPDDSEMDKKVYVDDKGNIRGEVIELPEGQEAPVTSYQIETRKIKANDVKDLTKENFRKVKEILTKRLNGVGAIDYAVRMDETKGNMVVELSKNDNVDFLYSSALMPKGNISIVDKQTGIILMDNKDIKAANAATSQTSDVGYTVYLQLELTKEGQKKFENLSQRFIKYTSGNDNQEKTELIQIKFDDQVLLETYFEEKYTQSIINIPMVAEVSSSENIKVAVDQVQAIANTINFGELPVEYKVETQVFVKSQISENVINGIWIAAAVILVIMLIFFIIKFKKMGFVAGILNAGYIGLVFLVLRLLQIVISFSSVIAIYMIIALNFMFVYMLLKATKNNEEFIDTFKKYYLIIAPIIIIGFVFTFFANEVISGIGYVLFWSILIQVLYNLIITRIAINDK